MICRPINYIGHSAKTLSSTARAYNSENNVSTDDQVKSNQRTFKILLCREQEYGLLFITPIHFKIPVTCFFLSIHKNFTLH